MRNYTPFSLPTALILLFLLSNPPVQSSAISPQDLPEGNSNLFKILILWWNVIFPGFSLTVSQLSSILLFFWQSFFFVFRTFSMKGKTSSVASSSRPLYNVAFVNFNVVFLKEFLLNSGASLNDVMPSFWALAVCVCGPVQHKGYTLSHSLLTCPWAPQSAHTFREPSPTKCLLDPHLKHSLGCPG